MNKTTSVLLYNFALIAGASFLVAVYDWSLWTYFWAICFMVTVSDNG